MKLTSKTTRLLLVVVILLFVGRIASTYRVFNDTTDENLHIGAGLEYLQLGSYTFEIKHPPLGRVAVAILPYFFADLRLTPPYDRPFLSSHVWAVWETRDADYYWKTLTLARAGNLPFAVLLLLFVYRWGVRLYGKRAALTACLIAACCPSLIAHAGLATPRHRPRCNHTHGRVLFVALEPRAELALLPAFRWVRSLSLDEQVFYDRLPAADHGPLFCGSPLETVAQRRPSTA